MGMLTVLKGLLSFLTVFPVGGCEGRTCAECDDCFAHATGHMYLFPLVGGFIGLLAGMFGYVFRHLLPNLIVGMLTLGLLLLVTGVHHTDGLFDFGDGVVFIGTPEQKAAAMHDQRTGVAGVTLGIVTLGTTALSIAEMGAEVIIPALISSEVSAKLAMVVCAWAGKSAHPGLGRRFIEAMHGPRRRLRLVSALAISVSIAYPLLWIGGITALVAGIITALAIVCLSHRNFRGVTGDVIGATNDLARMFSLVTILGAVRWA